MVDMMLQSTKLMITKWDDCIKVHGRVVAEISVGNDLRGLSADVISRTCFGSSYSKGKQIFSQLRALQSLIASKNVLFGLPTSGLLSTRKQNEINSLEKEIGHLIWETIEERKKECFKEKSCEKDFLQHILQGAAMSDMGKDSSKKFIVDNCKNIYFAGHESTAVAAAWCLMLLALHPEWQDQIRKEISLVSPGGALDSHSLSKVKTV
ncbi:oxygenase [Lithospermum erythrorhizon]|uniref:Oxygenase n=1 Tax=Lithospermum erythrorhizon TaxID=34254 RepID=A0AAV3QVM6_LITER